MGILHALHYLWNVPIWVDHDEVEKKKKTINVELKTETIKRARIHPPTNHGGRSHQRHRPKIKSFWFHFIFEATPFTGKWRVIKLSRLTWFSQTILMSFAALYIMSFVIFEKLKWIDDDVFVEQFWQHHFVIYFVPLDEDCYLVRPLFYWQQQALLGT